WFLWIVVVVLVTAIAGSVFFRFRAFLAVLSLLVSYNVFAGYRVLKNKGRGPQRLDAFISALALVTGLSFIFYINRVTFPWSPVIIYATLGALFFVASYDVMRFLFPKRWHAALWLPEHIYKIVSAFGALFSAFMGTVAEAWQPYSQILPSALAMA